MRLPSLAEWGITSILVVVFGWSTLTWFANQMETQAGLLAEAISTID